MYCRKSLGFTLINYLEGSCLLSFSALIKDRFSITFNCCLPLSKTEASYFSTFLLFVEDIRREKKQKYRSLITRKPEA